MRKNLQFLVTVTVALAVAVSPWKAQAQGPSSGPKDSPAAEASVEGTVKKVNPSARTIDVSTGVPGLWDKRLELTDRTRIRDGRRAATLDDVQEGVKVKASYDTRVGHSFATRIELIPMAPPGQNPEPDELLRALP